MLGGRTEEFGLEGDPAADARAVVQALALRSCIVRPLVCELKTVTLAGPDLGRRETVRRRAWRLCSSSASTFEIVRRSGDAEERVHDELSPSVIDDWFSDVLRSASEDGRAYWNEFGIPVCAARVPTELGVRRGDSLILLEDGGELEATVTHDDQGAWAIAQRALADRPPVGISFDVMPAALALTIEVGWNIWWDDSGPGPDLSVWLHDLARIGWS